MEPIEGEVVVPLQFRIKATVNRCWQNGDDWYVQFDGSWESLSLGPIAQINGEIEDLPFVKGDAVDIIIRKRNAQPK